MKWLKSLLIAAVLIGWAAAAGAKTPDMANLVPADSKALIELVDAAGLRQMLLDSRFWNALQETTGFQEWRAGERYAQMHQRIQALLSHLEMTEDEALKTYLGGRSAVVLFAAEEKNCEGVFLTETTNEMADRLVRATGGVEVKRHRDIAIYEVQSERKTDRMAFAGGVLLVSGSKGDAMERVLDVMTAGEGTPLGADGRFKIATEGLPAGWRVRAYADESPPRKSPGAVAMYPQGNGRTHFEWRIVSDPADIRVTAPVVLTTPNALPDTAVAAISTALHTEALWNAVKAKAAARPDGADRLAKVEMFVRGWFPGQPMEAITGAFGNEAAAALLKGSEGGAPGLVGMAKLSATGRPVAQAFKDGLAAKAMIFGAFTAKGDEPPKTNVREEAYSDTSLLIIEAPQMLLKILGDWAKDIALTVAVTDDWIVVGTTPAGVKRTLDTIAGKTPSLAAALKQVGEKAPTAPATRWGVVQPAAGADIVMAWAERIAGKERIEQAKKATNLAELMKLVERGLWQRTDEPTVIRGSADIQAIK